MGSPVSVTVANLVMEDVEERAITSSLVKTPLWKCYVDDTCTALPRTQLEQFHTHLNSIEPSIDFTYELEDEGNMPFLDLNIKHHPDGTLSTNVFRKKTHTDKYLNFQSHHALAHKLAVVRTLHNRANTHCTFPSDRVEESKRVCRALQLNGYPRRWSQHNRDVAPSHPKKREDLARIVQQHMCGRQPEPSPNA